MEEDSNSTYLECAEKDYRFFKRNYDEGHRDSGNIR